MVEKGNVDELVSMIFSPLAFFLYNSLSSKYSLAYREHCNEREGLAMLTNIKIASTISGIKGSSGLGSASKI